MHSSLAKGGLRGGFVRETLTEHTVSHDLQQDRFWNVEWPDWVREPVGTRTRKVGSPRQRDRL